MEADDGCGLPLAGPSHSVLRLPAAGAAGLPHQAVAVPQRRQTQQQAQQHRQLQRPPPQQQQQQGAEAESRMMEDDGPVAGHFEAAKLHLQQLALGINSM